jgi:flagellar basal body-associated protein FliL
MTKIGTDNKEKKEKPADHWSNLYKSFTPRQKKIAWIIIVCFVVFFTVGLVVSLLGVFKVFTF